MNERRIPDLPARQGGSHALRPNQNGAIRIRRCRFGLLDQDLLPKEVRYFSFFRLAMSIVDPLLI